MFLVVVVVVVVLLIFLIILLYSYATSAGMVSTGGGRNPYISTTLPQGNKSEDYNIIIRVDIFDQKGASQVDILNVKVSFLLELSFPITLHRNE